MISYLVIFNEKIYDVFEKRGRILGVVICHLEQKFAEC